MPGAPAIGATTRPMPIAKLAQETLRVTLLALVGFAVLRYLAEKFNVPGLRAALGAAGTAA